MAKLTAPLLSFGSRGQIAKTMVTATWRGVKYARQYVIPANPASTEQMLTRDLFAWLREAWKLAPADVLAPWNSFAQGRPFTGMNSFVGENVRVMRGETDTLLFIGSPGSKGGIAPLSFAVATGAGAAGTIEGTVTAPTPPSGWSVDETVVMGLPEQDPTTGLFTGPIVAGTGTSGVAVSLAGFAAAATITLAGWIKWVKPDGSFAYSVGITDSGTSHA